MKKWIICFKYTNNQGERKEYKRTYDINKAPFVIKGVVNDKANIVKQREKRANEYIRVLANKLDVDVFDVDRGEFEVDKLELPIEGYVNDWLIWKKNKVKLSSYQLYREKMNVFQDWLNTNNLSGISLKRFDYTKFNKFLLFVQTKSSNKSYNYYLTIFKNIYKYLIKIQRMKGVDNITDNIEKLKEDDTEKYALFSNIEKAFTDLTEHNYYLGFMAKCIYYTLHRINTLTSLQFKDFDLERGIINIPSAKIKTGKKLSIRISRHLLQDIINYVEENKPDLNSYFFGNNGFTKNTINLIKTDIKMFGKNKTNVNVFTQQFKYFKELRTTDKKLFTNNHQLYGFKHNGIKYYKDANFNDAQIIQVTGHRNVSILATYSRQYEAIVSEDLFKSLP